MNEGGDAKIPNSFLQQVYSSSPQHKKARSAAAGSNGPGGFVAQPTQPVQPANGGRLQPLSNLELTQAFLAHEEQLSLLQLQCAAVYKLPAEGHLAQQFMAAVETWKKSHTPGKPHPVGACSTAVAMVLLYELSQSRPPADGSPEDLPLFFKTAESLLSSDDPSAVAREVCHCSAKLNAKKTHCILDFRPTLYGQLAPFFRTITLLLDSYESERLGKKAPGGLSRKARGRP